MRSHDEQTYCGDEGLDALASAVARSAEPMPDAARAEVRARLLAAIAPSSVPLHVRLLRPAVALVTVGSLLGGVSYAAAGSRPGEPLFGLKQSIVSTVRSAQSVLSRHTSEQRVPAVLAPVEAPAEKGPDVPSAGTQGVEASSKATKAATSTPGQGKAMGQGNGNGVGKAKGDTGSKPKGHNGNGSSRRRMRRSSRGPKG